MKLQIVEYCVPSILEGFMKYRYVLQLDERALAWSVSRERRLQLNDVYDTLTMHLLNGNLDYNLEHYPEVGPLYGIECEVIYEQEVSNSYLKDLYVKSRIKEIEGDFV